MGTDSIALWICNYSPQNTARRTLYLKIASNVNLIGYGAPHPSRDHAEGYGTKKVVWSRCKFGFTFKYKPSFLPSHHQPKFTSRTKQNDSGISAERATPRRLLSELFSPPPHYLPKGPSDHPCLPHTGGTPLLKLLVLGPYRCAARKTLR